MRGLSRWGNLASCSQQTSGVLPSEHVLPYQVMW